MQSESCCQHFTAATELPHTVSHFRRQLLAIMVCACAKCLQPCRHVLYASVDAAKGGGALWGQSASAQMAQQAAAMQHRMTDAAAPFGAHQSWLSLPQSMMLQWAASRLVWAMIQCGSRPQWTQALVMLAWQSMLTTSAAMAVRFGASGAEQMSRLARMRQLRVTATAGRCGTMKTVVWMSLLARMRQLMVTARAGRCGAMSTALWTLLLVMRRQLRVPARAGRCGASTATYLLLLATRRQLEGSLVKMTASRQAILRRKLQRKLVAA